MGISSRKETKITMEPTLTNVSNQNSVVVTDVSQTQSVEVHHGRPTRGISASAVHNH